MTSAITTTCTAPAADHHALQHDDHIDYLHDGHWHSEHAGHYDEHVNLDTALGNDDPDVAAVLGCARLPLSASARRPGQRRPMLHRG